jgi:hypothetical protein
MQSFFSFEHFSRSQLIILVVVVGFSTMPQLTSIFFIEHCYLSIPLKNQEDNATIISRNVGIHWILVDCLSIKYL